MTKKRFTSKVVDWWHNVDVVRVVFDDGEWISADECAKLLNKLNDENEQLKQQVEDLEFKLRTIKAYDRTIKEEHSDTVYDFQKKIERW